MPVLTPDQKKRLGPPPKPYAPEVVLTKPDGRPTGEFHLYLTKLDNWQKKLVQILTE